MPLPTVEKCKKILMRSALQFNPSMKENPAGMLKQNFTDDDQIFMRRALVLARQAADVGEIPVGAVLVCKGEIVGEGFNAPVATHDPTEHAEIAAIRTAARKLGNYRLPGCTLYVTLEPCVMCAGAIQQARLERVVYAAIEPKTGAHVSSCLLLGKMFPGLSVEGGLFAEESQGLLTTFFGQRRQQQKDRKGKGMKVTVSISEQTLTLSGPDDLLLARYPVSTAAAGVGEEMGSYKTPRGFHRVRAKIGAGQPENTVFVGRRPTGEIWSPELAASNPDRDWILTRILWLCGCEPGRNRWGRVDTMCRYIYIHGTPDTTELGVPDSQGCIRMRNRDLIELFDRISPGTPVEIRG